jgi:serine phosphatase RsbU (regulator of sigma subunit)
VFKGITAKMMAAIVLSVLGTAIALTAISSVLVTYTLRVGLRTRLDETSKLLSEALSGRLRQLGIRTDIDAQDENFQTSFAFRDVERQRLQRDLGERLGKLGGAMGLITDADGASVASADKTAGGDGDPLAHSRALDRARKSDKQALAMEAIGGRLLFVAASPIKRYGEQTLGYLAMASAVDEPVLQQIKEASGADVMLVVNGKPVAQTAALGGAVDRLAAIERELRGRKGAAPLEGSWGGDELLMSAMPLRAGDELQATLLYALSARDAHALQSRILTAALSLSIITLGLSGVLGLLLARRIANPIIEIEQSFHQIAASGDLSRRITKTYPDEVGRMASSFNDMQQKVEQLHQRVVTAEERMRGELKMAAAVQEMLFPTTVIDGARCQIASNVQTSTETGGDWYAIIHAPEAHLTTCIIADVTGHGAPAALVTAILHGYFKATQDELSRLGPAEWEPGVQRILQRLNQLLIESTRRSLVCSLFLLSFDHRTLTARYANAGHVAPVLVRTVDGKPQVTVISTPPSPLIGDLDDPAFVTGELAMHPEELFILYTDGLIECTNQQHEMYGFRRLRKRLVQLGHHDARSVRDLVLEDALAFFGDMRHADDITLLVGRVR